MSNDYSPQWFDNFLSPIPPEQTAREIAFLARSLFQPTYTTLLDVCCGMGRHARPLSQRGYRVVGVDTNSNALAQAKRDDPLTRYLQGDMRALDTLQESFDAVLVLWQSFGNFDAATNVKILGNIANLLNPHGRLVLDLYNRAFHESRLGVRVFERKGRTITETKTMADDRLCVVLDYGETRDEFEWQVFYPDEIAALAAQHSLTEILRCANYDKPQTPEPDLPRMQCILEKSA